ncbi:MAG: allophanate hydrolase subunit 1, partial [Deltaproteobacteria bacterium]|nr:allophanate hydrolase subunit 1 [Deltaproteobacteria bacterium]
MLYDPPIFRLMGDRALLVELGDQISPSINEKVRELFLKLDRRPPEGVVELVPSYRSLMIVYDPLRTGFDQLREAILQLHQAADP